MKKIKLITLLIIVSLLFTSCKSLIDGLTQSLYSQKDVKLVEDGAPSYLLLVEGLIHANNKNKTFLLTGIQLFSAYSGAFIKEPERKKIFSDKTKNWALDLLRTFPKFKKLENAEFDEYEKWVDSIGKNDIDYAFWAAYAWVMWIISNTDDMSAMLELPKARVIIDRIYELDPSYYYGAPHLFYGMYYSFLPEFAGGDMTKARTEFEKALEYSDEKLLMTKVTYAEFYLKKKYDKKNYIKTINEVINTDLDKHPEMRLMNTLAQEQAKELLNSVDEFFFEDDF